MAKIQLPNGCSMSNPSVNPKDWKSGGTELLDHYWRIQYYFYDPSHPKQKKLVVVKGMNEYRTLIERRSLTREIILDEIDNNLRGFNPILKKFVHNKEHDELSPDLPIIDSLKLALGQQSVSEKHRYQVQWCLSRIEESIIKLKYHRLSISSLQRGQLKRILETSGLTPSVYNKFLAYLSSLFRELLQYDCCQSNLARDISKKKLTVRDRRVLSDTEFNIIMAYLKENYYEFYRYTAIFFCSGARSTELIRLKIKDVDLEAQEYTVLIKKGNQYRQVIKVILKEAAHLWKEIISQGSPDHYLFSKRLKPGPDKILANQVTKRWYRLVKKSDKILDENMLPLKVTADFYSLKHYFLDKLSEDSARAMASHTNFKTTRIYRINQEKRDREALKLLETNLRAV